MIHIGIAFDNNYIRQFHAWVASLEKNNQGNALHIHSVCNDLSEEESEIIKNKISGFAKISFYRIDNKKVENLVLPDQWTPAVYYRIFLPLMIPEEISRLLYLDLDTLITGDLNSLYLSDLNGFAVAAVYDNYVRNQPGIEIYDEGNYFNSGMLLIDTKKWREQDITPKAIKFLSQYPEKILFVDQCALNAVLKGNWQRLPEKYNLLYSYIPDHPNQNQLKKLLSETVILHFTLQRPWNMLCQNRYRDLYFKYLKESGIKVPGKYDDFQISKIPAWIKIRLLELYLDITLFSKTWRFLKNISLKQNEKIKSPPI
jgi:lipopolysaccharide biosynthesis glycosyltransferase